MELKNQKSIAIASEQDISILEEQHKKAKESYNTNKWNQDKWAQEIDKLDDAINDVQKQIDKANKKEERNVKLNFTIEFVQNSLDTLNKHYDVYKRDKRRQLEKR